MGRISWAESKVSTYYANDAIKAYLKDLDTQENAIDKMLCALRERVHPSDLKEFNEAVNRDVIIQKLAEKPVYACNSRWIMHD